MHRLPRPLTLPALHGMMKDQRYWNRNHPDHIDWVKLVTQGFEKLFPGPLKRDATGRQIDPLPRPDPDFPSPKKPGKGFGPMPIPEYDPDPHFGIPPSPPHYPGLPRELQPKPGEYGDMPLLMPASVVDMGTSSSSAPAEGPTGTGGQVHVRSYIRHVNGQPVEVEEHWRSVAPGHGRNRAGTAAKDDPLRSLITLMSQIAAMAGVPPALINAIGQALPMLNMVGGVLGNALGNALDNLGTGANTGNGETITGLSAGDTIPQDSPPNLFEMPLPSEGGGEGQAGPVQVAEAETVLPGRKPQPPAVPDRPPESSSELYRPQPLSTIPDYRQANPNLPNQLSEFNQLVAQNFKDAGPVTRYALSEIFVAEGGYSWLGKRDANGNPIGDGVFSGIGNSAFSTIKGLQGKGFTIDGIEGVQNNFDLSPDQLSKVYYYYIDKRGMAGSAHHPSVLADHRGGRGKMARMRRAMYRNPLVKNDVFDRASFFG